MLIGLKFGDAASTASTRTSSRPAAAKQALIRINRSSLRARLITSAGKASALVTSSGLGIFNGLVYLLRWHKWIKNLGESRDVATSAYEVVAATQKIGIS